MTTIDQFVEKNILPSRSEELPRPQEKSIYLVSSLAFYQEHQSTRIDVWFALGALVAGLAISPLDFAVGAVLGIPGLLYLVVAAKGRNVWK